MNINDSRMTCEESGDVGHLGNNCPTIQEDVNCINNNNNNRPQPNHGWNQQNQRWNQQQQRPNYQGNNFNNYNQPPLRDLVASQFRLLDEMSKKVASNDKALENINARMDTFASTIKN
jgi:hypothetical protein